MLALGEGRGNHSTKEYLQKASPHESTMQTELEKFIKSPALTKEGRANIYQVFRSCDSGCPYIHLLSSSHQQSEHAHPILQMRKVKPQETKNSCG